MSGGKSSSTQNGNGMVDFNPTSIGGGNIQVGGNVGQGAVSQQSSSQASGPSVGIDFKMSMPGMDGMPGMGGSGFGGEAASPAAGLPDMAGLANIAGLGLMNLKALNGQLGYPKFYKLQNLKGRDAPIGMRNPFNIPQMGYKLMNLQESQYVPFGPSAGQGWQTDIGDSMTDTAIMGASGYKTYKASQPAIDAIWKMLAPKSHDAIADKTFQAITDVKEVGKSMGGWNAFGQMGQEIAGRPAIQPQPAQQAAEQWQQVDERFLLWASTGQYYDSYYQLYYDPQSEQYYDGQGGQWSVQETQEYYTQLGY